VPILVFIQVQKLLENLCKFEVNSQVRMYLKLRFSEKATKI
jgi:hypothetical protein